MKTEKLCINCKWSRQPKFGSLVCDAPKNNLPPDLVNGSVEKKFEYCSTHRLAGNGWFYARFANICGFEGRWFEPKDSSKK